MDFGIMTAKIDEIGYVTHAENLGFSHCWVTDSPIIRSNCWAVLALAAQATRTMRIGTGVNVPALRLAPAAANGIATINRLAPGRCFIGFGTGHTGLRLLGRKPMRLAPFREYVDVVRRMLRGEEVAYTLEGETHPIRFQMREHRFIDLEAAIPVYVGGIRSEGAGAGRRDRRRAHLRAAARRGAAGHAGQRAAGGRAGRPDVAGRLLHLGDGDAGDAGAGRGAGLAAHRRRLRRRRAVGAALPGGPPPRDRRGAARLRARDLEGLSGLAERGAARGAPPAPARQPLQLPRRRGGAVPDRRPHPRQHAGRQPRGAGRAGPRARASGSPSRSCSTHHSTVSTESSKISPTA